MRFAPTAMTKETKNDGPVSNDDEKIAGNDKIAGETGDEKKPGGLRALSRTITLEPMILPYLIASILVILTNQNLNIQRACRVNMNFSAEVCNELENKDNSSSALDDIEVVVQKLVADMLIWQTIIQSSVPAILVLFLGSWSDRNRLRRPCMLLPVYGELIRNIGLLVFVNFFDNLPMEVTGLWQSLPMALTGYWTVFFMAVFAYIGDISTDSMKTVRIGTVNLTMALCLPIGTGMSGILYRKLGFTGVYTIALILCLISILLAHICVHDTKRIKFDSGKGNKTSYWSQIKFFFDLKHVVNAFEVTFKKEKNNRRLKVIALTLLITGIMGPLQGDKGVAYLFTRVKFNWNEVQYSVFSTTSMCINLVGTVIVVGVVSKKFGIDDALIGTIATTTKFISQFVFAFATSEVIFYSGLFVNCLQGPAIISMKSILNKIIPAEEIGQVMSVTSIGENAIPVLCGPLYSYVYETTVDYFPGAYFLVTASITIPTIFLYLWLYLQHKKETSGSYENINFGKKREKSSDVKKSLKDATSTFATYGSTKQRQNGLD